MTVEYRVLGPLEMSLDGEPVAAPCGRGRVLLATLLLCRPRAQDVADDRASAQTGPWRGQLRAHWIRRRSGRGPAR